MLWGTDIKCNIAQGVRVEIKSLSNNGNRNHITFKRNCVRLSILVKIHRTIEIGLDPTGCSFGWFRTFGFLLY